MSKAFNLTAEINLRGPANIRTVVADIRRQLGTINVNINPQINSAAQKNITNLNASLTRLNTTFGNTATAANNAAQAIRNFNQSITNAATNNFNRNLNSAINNTNKLGNSAKNTANQINNSTTKMEEFGRQSALAIKRFAAFSIVTSAIYSFTGAVSKGLKAFIDFDKEFVRLQQVTGQNAKGLQALSSQITQLSTSLGVSSSELTKVSVTLAQAGLSAKDTTRALKALALSSLAPSFDDINQTVEGSIALMKQFNIGAQDLESALGSVNAVAAAFAVEASDLITAIQRTGGVFATASKGVSEGKDALNEFLAVFTSIRATTRESAETIATGLRTIFARIQRVDTIDALKQYGVQLTDLQGKFVGPYEAVKRLSEGLSKLDPRDIKFAQIVEELGGFRQIGKVIPLIQQFTVAQNALNVAQQGSGSLANDAATAQLSLANQIAKVQEQFTALIRSIGESDSFKTMVKLALDLASALITVADAAKNVLPAITAMAAFGVARSGIQFARGFGRGFAKGGLVPGSGNRDTVSAMLTPGEFVIRKKAVEAIGTDKLHKMNKYANGGKVRKFVRGGMADAPMVDDILQTTGSMLPKPSAIEALIRAGGGAVDMDRTLKRTIGDKAYGKASSPGAKKNVLDRFFTDEAARLQDIKSSPLTGFGKALQDAIRSGQLKGSRVSIISKSTRTKGVPEYLSQLFGIPVQNMVFTQGGTKQPAIDAIRSKGPRIERVGRFATGGLIQKFAQTNPMPGSGLVKSMGRSQIASILKIKSNSDLYKNLGSRGPEGAKLREEYTAKANEALTKKMQSGKQFALVGLFGGKGQVSTMSNNKPPVPLSISYSSLDNSSSDGTWNSTLGQEYEAIMRGRFSDTIKFIGRDIAGRIGAIPVSNQGQIEKIMKKSGVEAVVGAMLEGSLGIAGAPFNNDAGKQNASIDFPSGLGPNLSSLFGGVGNGIPTDATRDIKGKGISRFVKQVSRYIEQQRKLSAPDLATNPNVARLAGGGNVDSVPALLTPGEFVINKRAASRLGSARLHQLNKADKIQGFNNGGVVQKFVKGGVALNTLSQNDPKSYARLTSALQYTGTARGTSQDYVQQAFKDFIQSLDALDMPLEQSQAAIKGWSRSINQGSGAAEAFDRAMEGATKSAMYSGTNRSGGGGGGGAMGRMAGKAGGMIRAGLNNMGPMGGMMLTTAGGAVVEGLARSMGGQQTEAGRTTSAVGGAMMNYGALGASIGSMFGPMGTALGVAVGGLAGFVVGLHDAKIANEEYVTEQLRLSAETSTETGLAAVGRFTSLSGQENVKIGQKKQAATQAEYGMNDIRAAELSRRKDLEKRNKLKIGTGDLEYNKELRDIEAGGAKAAEEYLFAQMTMLGKNFEETKKSMDPGLFDRLATDIAEADNTYISLRDAQYKVIQQLRDQGKGSEADALQAKTDKELKELRDRLAQRNLAEENAAIEAKKLADAQAKAATILINSTMSVMQSLDAVEQSFNKTAFNISKLGKVKNEILTGKKSLTSTQFEDTANILKNPLAYSKSEREAAMGTTKGYFGSVGERLVSMSQFSDNATNAGLKAYTSKPARTKEQQQERLGSVEEALRDQVYKNMNFPELRGSILDNIEEVFKSAAQDIEAGKEININELIQKALGPGAEVSKKAADLLIKANEEAASAVNALGEASQASADIMLNIRSREAGLSSMQAKSRISQKEALGIDVGLGERLSANMAESASMLGMNPNQVNTGNIVGQRFRLGLKQSNLTSEIKTTEQAAMTGDKEAGQRLIQLQQNLANVNNELKITEEELSKLPQTLEQSIGDVMGEMQKRIQYLEARKQAGTSFAEKLVTSTPQEMAELNSTYQLMSNTIKGNITTIDQSQAAQRAYYKTLLEGRSQQEAMGNAQTAFANENRKALDMFNELSQVAGLQGPELDQQRANLIENFAASTGQRDNPLIQDILAQLRQDPKERAANDPVLIALQEQAAALREEQVKAVEATNALDREKQAQLLDQISNKILTAFQGVADTITSAISELSVATGGTPIVPIPKPVETQAVPVPSVQSKPEGRVSRAEAAFSESGISAYPETSPLGDGSGAAGGPPPNVADHHIALTTQSRPGVISSPPSQNINPYQRPNTPTGNLIPQGAPAPRTQTEQLITQQREAEQQARTKFEQEINSASSVREKQGLIYAEGKRQRAAAYTYARSQRGAAAADAPELKRKQAEQQRLNASYAINGVAPVVASPTNQNTQMVTGTGGATTPNAANTQVNMSGRATPQNGAGIDMQVFTNFGKYVEQLSTINLPSNITLNLTGTVSVEITGAAAWEGLNEGIRTMVDNSINARMRELNVETEGGLGNRPRPSRTNRSPEQAS